MIPAAAGEPQIDRIAQALEIDTGSAIDRTQERYRLVGRRPAAIPGDAVETAFHVPAGDGIEWTRLPVAETSLEPATINLVGALGPVGIACHVRLKGLLQHGHARRRGAPARRVGGGLVQNLPRQTARPAGRYLAMVAQDDTLVRGFSAAISGAVVDDEGFGPGGMHPDSKARELIIPGEPGFVPGLQRLDRVLVRVNLFNATRFADGFIMLPSWRARHRNGRGGCPALQVLAQMSDRSGSPCVGPLRRIHLAGAPTH